MNVLKVLIVESVENSLTIKLGQTLFCGPHPSKGVGRLTALATSSEDVIDHDMRLKTSINLIAAAAFLLCLYGSVQAMTSRVTVEDLRNQGLQLITADNPQFDGLLSGLLSGQTEAILEALKPYSVFLRNTGERPVVAYTIQWKLTAEDGRIVNRTESSTSSWYFTPAGRRNMVRSRSASQH